MHDQSDQQKVDWVKKLSNDRLNKGLFPKALKSLKLVHFKSVYYWVLNLVITLVVQVKVVSDQIETKSAGNIQLEYYKNRYTTSKWDSTDRCPHLSACNVVFSGGGKPVFATKDWPQVGNELSVLAV